MGSFALRHAPLAKSSPQWGDVALLSWDAEIFGFPVAEYRVGTSLPESGALCGAMRRFADETHAELISARLPAASTNAIAVLGKAGFSPVDLSLDAVLPRLQSARIPEARFTLRQAAPEDGPEIRRTAGRAFHFGRYHTDPRFPRDLADRRYVRWMDRALSGSDPGGAVFVLGPPGKPLGFLHVAIEDGTADLRLGAADPDGGFGVVGLALYGEVLRAVRERGAIRAQARISAANTSVLNVCATLGFQFRNPETILHWHAPAAPHLEPM